MRLRDGKTVVENLLYRFELLLLPPDAGRLFTSHSVYFYYIIIIIITFFTRYEF